MRALAATGAAGLSLWALNLSGTAGGWGASATAGHSSDGARAAAEETATSGGGHADKTASGRVGAGMLQEVIPTDPQAVVTFPHAVIGSYDGSPLAVNPAGFGRPPAGFLMAPLEQLYASSPFGFRISPLSGAAGDFHLGQDYAAACGTTVYAADSGVVRAAGWHPWGGGNRVEIDHGNGLITTYNHLDAIAVHTGDPVRAGQAIARVGSTGWSTGCHLHFETILDGRHTSPAKWGLVPTRPLDGSKVAEMRSYLPGSGFASEGNISWALPLEHGDEHQHAGFLHKKPAVPALPPWALPPAAGAAAPAPSAAPSPRATTPSPTPGATSPEPHSVTPSAPSPATPVPSPTPGATNPAATPTATNPSAATPIPGAGTPSTTQSPSPAAPPASPTPGATAPATTPAPGGTTPAPTPSAPAPTSTTASPSPSVPNPATGASPSAPSSETPSAPTAGPTPPASVPAAGPSSDPAPAATTPSPTPSDPARCPAEPTQETPSPDQYGGLLATNDAREQLPEDAACGTPVPNPANPE